jgi:hypothetical protein
MKYINIWEYQNNEYPFQIFIGGRGTGKTYSALSGALQLPDKFLYMRRTAQELDLMLDSEKYGEGANPFKPINRDFNKDVGFAKIVKNLAGIYNREMIDGKMKCTGAPLGYGVALSTISSIRSVDFSDCSDCIYDEFIPETHVKKIKGEGTALLNAYETICRNRELADLPALRLWLLANSNNIYNDIFVELGIVSEVERMVRKGQGDKYIKERGLAIHLINNNEEFVNQKRETALYKLTKGSRFADMALNNKFAFNDFSLIRHEKITGYRPICGFGKGYIYGKKGDSMLYVTYAAAKCVNYDIETEQGRRNFYNMIGRKLNEYFINSRIIFESYELKQTILDLIY